MGRKSRSDGRLDAKGPAFLRYPPGGGKLSGLHDTTRPKRGTTLTRKLLIYEELTPVSSERHRDWSVKASGDLSFARNVNSVPLTAVEFREAAVAFPIVFAESGDGVVPVALFGMRPEENLFVEEDGSWNAPYVPAFLRRYPFVFVSSPAQEAESQRLTLCIDESYAGCNQEGLGERIFDAEGERTGYLGQVLGFQQDYQAQAQRTQAFCARLQELDLLEPMTAKGVGVASGQPIAVSGFQGVARAKLYELAAEPLRELSSTGQLELAYIHLQSLTNFRTMFGATSLAPRTAEASSSGRGNGSGVAPS